MNEAQLLKRLMQLDRQRETSEIRMSFGQRIAFVNEDNTIVLSSQVTDNISVIQASTSRSGCEDHGYWAFSDSRQRGQEEESRRAYPTVFSF